MLRLCNITKNYITAGSEVPALRGVDIGFRKSEFVSILGPSGCGKTTLLNIIGGLDQYTSGDLVINGKSTKDFTDGDWDAYRNRSIGFVFQSYNLIPHQTVLANVELALTLSGVSRSERRERAKEALNKVGLGDQLRKKPNQMSGGQMQRVAIARALVNNPDILLADEPTGALDSATSVQIMDILREVARDRLVIMVTHNPELAERYSTRIVRLLDGKIVSDTSPYTVEEEPPKPTKKKTKKPSMSFFTALSLSFNNLMTKKARTFLTSFAGSIGIIGIALILALSSGVSAYISGVEEDTLSSYPVTIEKTTMDMTDMMSTFMGGGDVQTNTDLTKIYSTNVMLKMLDMTLSSVIENDLAAFVKFLETDGSEIRDLSTDIKYSYSTVMNIYKADTSDGVYRVNPSDVMKAIGFGGNRPSADAGTEADMNNRASALGGGTNVWKEIIDNDSLFDSQFDVIAGRKPTAYNEVVIAVSESNEISDYTLYSLGLLDINELKQMVSDKMKGGKFNSKTVSYTYDELLKLEFSMLPNSAYFEKNGDVWVDRSSDDDFVRNALETGGITLKVVGIVRPADGSAVNVGTGYVGYLHSLTEHLINTVNDSEVVRAQKADPDTDIFTGLAFDASGDDTVLTMEAIEQMITAMPEEQAATMRRFIETMRGSGMSDDEIAKTLSKSLTKPTTDATYEGNLTLLGVSDLAEPSLISIYPKDFEAKEKITALIDEYNAKVGKEHEIHYTDYVGMLMSSVTTIINAISYVLIAFVSISLVVSSIMIGIITYISVLERTKEIGVLRAIGASKHDISRVFNAETITIGFVAGALGIGVTLLLTIPINIIIKSLTSIGGLCALPVSGAAILVAISVFLTFIAGLIPSRIAAKKDPVVALRTE